jgi:hypothetical protein
MKLKKKTKQKIKEKRIGSRDKKKKQLMPKWVA